MANIDDIQLNIEKSDRVDRFLRQEMSRKESIAFLDDIKTDSELYDIYRRQFELMRGIKFQQMSDLMKEKEKELSYIKPDTGQPINIFSRYRYAFSTVAVAAALICGVFVWDGSVSRNVGEQFYENVMPVRDRSFAEIDQLVGNEEYKAAIAKIEELESVEYELSSPEAIDAYNRDRNEMEYRKALIYLKMGKKAKAKAILKSLDDKRAEEVLNNLLW